MEIFLERPHAGVPWGFRIIGGSDSHLPIIVSKVIEDSIAEKAGLEEDVLLERVNNIPTCGLTHAEVNQIILSADKELFFTIKRENLENLILASLNDENNNSEIKNILRQAVTEGKITEENENTNCEEQEEIELKREFGVMIIDNTTTTNNKIREETKVLNRNQFGQIVHDPPPGKRWSTFLQRPKNPTPRPKNEPPAIPKADLYRVVITKQKKKEKIEPRIQVPVEEPAEIVQEQGKAEPEHSPEEDISLNTQEVEEPELMEEHQQMYMAECHRVEVIEEDNMMLEHFEEHGMLERQEDDNNNENECDRPDLNFEEESTIVETAPSLEEQLAAVQRQLQELAQLPSAIQETLSVVTQQLASIVGEHKPQTEETEQDEAINETVEEQEEGEVKQEEHTEQEENVEDFAGEVSETAEMEGPLSEVLSDICEEQEINETTEEENREPTAEEIEEERILQEKMIKQQQEYQQRLEEEENKLKKPVVRPIILPGGRKWVDPDDAVVKVKNPKMTDDKICNTLDTFSEVIVGKTKGINFLKYTPPSKNLDYLQRSEVYRLVHGMEPPVKGISIRSEKILAEQDYYSTNEH